MLCRNVLSVAFVATLIFAQPLGAIEIVVDYSFDSQGFFDDSVRRTAMEAVASRFSRVITSELTAVEPLLDLGQPTPWRLGFEHPGTGEMYQFSTAAAETSDPIFDAAGDSADLYGFEGLKANEWTLFAGGRSLVASGIGGTATGINFDTVFDDLDGPLHRGVISNTPEDSTNDIPAWGGAIAFNTAVDWHFELDEASAIREIDFYSIAMHEVGHALGLSTNWNQARRHVEGTNYRGEHVLAAYNADHGTSLTALSLDRAGDPHWLDEAYDSFIFAPGEPNMVGTVGDQLQDLLLEPSADFFPSVRRFELTNVDAGALKDLGWSILESNDIELDRNGDNHVDGQDVDLACSSGASLEPYYSALNSVQADLDFSGDVGFTDFLILSANFGSNTADYSSGDVTCDAAVGFDDFLVLSAAFGTSAGAQSVPEPSGLRFLLLAGLCVFCRRRKA